LAAFSRRMKGNEGRANTPTQSTEAEPEKQIRPLRTFSPQWTIGGAFQPKIEKKTALPAVQSFDF